MADPPILAVIRQDRRYDTDGPTLPSRGDPGGERLRHLSREDCRDSAPAGAW